MHVNSEWRLPDFSLIKASLESYDNAAGRHIESHADNFRSRDESVEILVFLEKYQERFLDFLNEQNSFLKLFESDFGSFKGFIKRESIFELCLRGEYLFSDTKKYPLLIENQFNSELLKSYGEIFEQWIKDVQESHQITQEWIKEDFGINRNLKSMNCQCIDCIAEFRSKLRSEIFNTSQVEITETIEKTLGNSDNLTLEEYSKLVYSLKKSIEERIFKARFSFRKSSLQKLERQLVKRLDDNFLLESDIGKKYKEKVEELFYKYLFNEGIDKDLVSDSELDRFLHQQGLDIWRSQAFLEKQFRKFISSLLLLKRKDVSSNILQDYLGQFWLHSEARKMNRKIIYHMGPTNSGKTYGAVQALSKAKKGSYLAPLRLLAGELYDTLNSRDVLTTLLTGEEVIELEGATHYSSTIEMAKLTEEFDCVVIDEIQMIGDPQRGWAWTRAIVNMLSPEIHLCGDDSVIELIQQIVELTGDTLEIKEYERMTKLEVEKNPITLGDLERGDALVVFSRRNALKYKYDLEQLGFKVSIVYGRLSPEVRREQARKFDIGETDIIVSTDAISMGMNLPIKRIVFSTLTKYFNEQEHDITKSEIKQIAGRAGRFGRFPIGYVTCLSRVESGIDKIEDALQGVLEQRRYAMVGPDLDIFSSVNNALNVRSFKEFRLPEFLRLFNTMEFQKPFYCVDLKEMIELAEMVEDIDKEHKLSASETFGFSCCPVNLGLISHVQYYLWIVNNYVAEKSIDFEEIEYRSNDIDYLETSIKCTELYQWLSRHFDNELFEFDEYLLTENKSRAVERLNELLSKTIIRYCSSCGVALKGGSQFNICEGCFSHRRRGGPRRTRKETDNNKNSSSGRGRAHSGKNHAKKKVTKKKTRKRRYGKK